MPGACAPVVAAVSDGAACVFEGGGVAGVVPDVVSVSPVLLGAGVGAASGVDGDGALGAEPVGGRELVDMVACVSDRPATDRLGVSAAVGDADVLLVGVGEGVLAGWVVVDVADADRCACRRGRGQSASHGDAQDRRSCLLTHYVYSLPSDSGHPTPVRLRRQGGQAGWRG